MNLVECLMKTGLTRHESELYIALCGKLTGYEAAKITGIPRANAYQALAGLVDKGGAYTIEGAVSHYTAMHVNEYCANVMVHLKEVTEKIKHDCPKVRKPSEPYIIVTGYKHIVDKIRNMVGSAKERVYVSMSEKELPFFKEGLERAVEKGLRWWQLYQETLALKGLLYTKQTNNRGR